MKKSPVDILCQVGNNVEAADKTRLLSNTSLPTGGALSAEKETYRGVDISRDNCVCINAPCSFGRVCEVDVNFCPRYVKQNSKLPVDSSEGYEAATYQKDTLSGSLGKSRAPRSSRGTGNLNNFCPRYVNQILQHETRLARCNDLGSHLPEGETRLARIDHDGSHAASLSAFRFIICSQSVTPLKSSPEGGSNGL